MGYIQHIQKRVRSVLQRTASEGRLLQRKAARAAGASTDPETDDLIERAGRRGIIGHSPISGPARVRMSKIRDALAAKPRPEAVERSGRTDRYDNDSNRADELSEEMAAHVDDVGGVPNGARLNARAVISGVRRLSATVEQVEQFDEVFGTDFASTYADIAGEEGDEERSTGRLETRARARGNAGPSAGSMVELLRDLYNALRSCDTEVDPMVMDTVGNFAEEISADPVGPEEGYGMDWVQFDRFAAKKIKRIKDEEVQDALAAVQAVIDNLPDIDEGRSARGLETRGVGPGSAIWEDVRDALGIIDELGPEFEGDYDAISAALEALDSDAMLAALKTFRERLNSGDVSVAAGPDQNTLENNLEFLETVYQNFALANNEGRKSTGRLERRSDGDWTVNVGVDAGDSDLDTAEDDLRDHADQYNTFNDIELVNEGEEAVEYDVTFDDEDDASDFATSLLRGEMGGHEILYANVEAQAGPLRGRSLKTRGEIRYRVTIDFSDPEGDSRYPGETGNRDHIRQVAEKARELGGNTYGSQMSDRGREFVVPSKEAADELAAYADEVGGYDAQIDELGRRNARGLKRRGRNSEHSVLVGGDRGLVLDSSDDSPIVQLAREHHALEWNSGSYIFGSRADAMAFAKAVKRMEGIDQVEVYDDDTGEKVGRSAIGLANKMGFKKDALTWARKEGHNVREVVRDIEAAADEQDEKAKAYSPGGDDYDPDDKSGSQEMARMFRADAKDMRYLAQVVARGDFDRCEDAEPSDTAARDELPGSYYDLINAFYDAIDEDETLSSYYEGSARGLRSKNRPRLITRAVPASTALSRLHDRVTVFVTSLQAGALSDLVMDEAEDLASVIDAFTAGSYTPAEAAIALQGLADRFDDLGEDDAFKANDRTALGEFGSTIRRIADAVKGTQASVKTDFSDVQIEEAASGLVEKINDSSYDEAYTKQEEALFTQFEADYRAAYKRARGQMPPEARDAFSDLSDLFDEVHDAKSLRDVYDKIETWDGPESANIDETLMTFFSEVQEAGRELSMFYEEGPNLEKEFEERSGKERLIDLMRGKKADVRAQALALIARDFEDENASEPAPDTSDDGIDLATAVDILARAEQNSTNETGNQIHDLVERASLLAKDETPAAADVEALADDTETLAEQIRSVEPDVAAMLDDAADTLRDVDPSEQTHEGRYAEPSDSVDDMWETAAGNKAPNPI